MIFRIIILVFFVSPLFSQEDFGYNLLQEKQISAYKSATKPKQIYLSKFWRGLPNHVPDLVSKSGYYPNEIEKYYYFNHYLGLKLYDSKKSNKNTFATTKLKHKIEKGKTYTIYIGGFFPYEQSFIEGFIRDKFHLRTEFLYQKNRAFARKEILNFMKVPIGFSFSKNPPQSVSEARKKAKTEIISAKGFFKYYTKFTAEEDAEYLTIGNFLKNKDLPKESLFEIDKYALIFEVNVSEEKVDNLIPNGDFEQFNEEPTNFGQWWRLEHWFNPNPNREFNEHLPSPDLITKGGRFRNSPSIRNQGTGRVGYINFDTLIFNEGLSVKLKEKLKKGKRYALSFNVGSTNKTTNRFIKKKITGTDLDSLKVQFGFSTFKPSQGKGKILEAEQLLQYSQFLSYLFNNKVAMLTFTAEDAYEYFTFGYFEELDLPSNGTVGVRMDDLYLYEIPEEILAPEDNYAFAFAENPEKINPTFSKKVGQEQTIPASNPNKDPEKQVAVVTKKPDSTTIKIPEPEKPKISEFYNETDSTKVTIKHELAVNTNQCKLIVYDHGTEDGDIVTLKLNDTNVVEHLKIRRKPNVATFNVELKKGENFLYPIAENLGRIPPNTIQVIVDCGTGSEEQSFRLFSKPGISDALRLEFNTK